MLEQYIETPTTPQNIRLDDFETAGVRVAERWYAARDMIFAPGDPDDNLYFLLAGTVRLYKIYGEHKEATVALLKDGGAFGELNLDVGQRQNTFAEAVTGTRVAVVRKSILNEAIKRSPDFAIRLFSSLAERLRRSDEVIESLLHREVSARLATLLLNLGDRFGEANGSDTVLKIRLTHQDLANMIVCTREAVSKMMGEFQRDGLIKVQGRRIFVTPQLANIRLTGPSSSPGAAA